MDFLKPYSSQLLSVLRIITGLLLLSHATTKFFGFPVGGMNNTTVQSMLGAAGLLELVGGVLLIIGLFTRPAAFILSGMCAVAYFYVHSPRGFYPVYNAGEAAILFCFTLLYIAAAGGGAWSADRSFRGAKD